MKYVQNTNKTPERPQKAVYLYFQVFESDFRNKTLFHLLFKLNINAVNSSRANALTYFNGFQYFVLQNSTVLPAFEPQRTSESE